MHASSVQVLSRHTVQAPQRVSYVPVQPVPVQIQSYMPAPTALTVSSVSVHPKPVPTVLHCTPPARGRTIVPATCHANQVLVRNMSPSPALARGRASETSRAKMRVTKPAVKAIHFLPAQSYSCPRHMSVRVIPSYLPSTRRAPSPRKYVNQLPVPVDVERVGPVDVQPWIDAAREFEMNTDFDVSAAISGRPVSLPALMSVMKEESKGKRTIQALADKLMLHRIIKNIGLPQMPALLEVDGVVEKQQIANFIREHLSESGAPDVVVKPSHLSNGKGVLIVSVPDADEVNDTVSYLVSHIRQHLKQNAGSHESLALRSLRPGFITQPKYRSVIGFRAPLELRIVVLWGKARLALWWWGRGAQADEFPNRNAWFARRPASAGELSSEDSWELIHEHVGQNPGFDKAVALFHRHVSEVARMAEVLAVAVGAPFLRCDFFVGSTKWGVRLNEVAYGCGVDYRNNLDDGNGNKRIIDDAPAIAKILREGMTKCKQRCPPEHFLAKLGVRGKTYEDMSVDPQSPLAKLPMNTEHTRSCAEFEVPDELCNTFPKTSTRFQGPRSQSWTATPAVPQSFAAPPPICNGKASTRSYSLNSAQQRSKSPGIRTPTYYIRPYTPSYTQPHTTKLAW